MNPTTLLLPLLLLLLPTPLVPTPQSATALPPPDEPFIGLSDDHTLHIRNPSGSIELQGTELRLNGNAVVTGVEEEETVAQAYCMAVQSSHHRGPIAGPVAAVRRQCSDGSCRDVCQRNINSTFIGWQQLTGAFAAISSLQLSVRQSQPPYIYPGFGSAGDCGAAFCCCTTEEAAAILAVRNKAAFAELESQALAAKAAAEAATAAVLNLTQIVARLEQRLNDQAQLIAEQRGLLDTFERRPRALGTNLLANSLMKDLSNASSPLPTGVQVHTFEDATQGPCDREHFAQISRKSRFTSCFEGPYVESRPAQSSATCDAANSTHPFFFGAFDGGPRAVGWNGIPNAQLYDPELLHLQGAQSPSFGIRTSQWLEGGQGHKTVSFTQRACRGPRVHVGFKESVQMLTGNRLWFRAWIRIVRGSGIALGSINNCLRTDPCGLWIDAETVAAGADSSGWYFIDTKVPVPSLHDPLSAFQLWPLGANRTDFSGDFELYLALPHVSLLADQHSWQWTVE